MNWLAKPRNRLRRAAPPALLALVAVVGCGGDAGSPTEHADAHVGNEAAPTPKRPRNVVIYLVDTLRASHLGVYGYGRDTSPRLNTLAGRAAVFENAYSSSPWTRTSVVTLFSGLHPETHGVQDKDDVAPDSLVTMAEAFADAGYRTAGFSSNISVSRKFNLHQGFESFTYFPYKEYFAESERPNPGYLPVDLMFPDIVEWVKRSKDEPFFLYIHTTDPHARYRPPESYLRWGREVVDRYDGEVLLSDDYFGRFMDLLALQGVLDDTLVIFTADHGEELMDHGRYGHGHTLYNELLHVPLIVWHPSVVPGRRKGVARLLDLFPTLTEWLDLPVEAGAMQGRSILPVLRGSSDPARRFRLVLGQVDYPSKIVGESLQVETWKVIHTAQDKWGKSDAWELYDLRSDPGEQHDLAGTRGDRLGQLRSKLVALQSWTAEQAIHPTIKQEFDAETEDALRSLGYIE